MVTPQLRNASRAGSFSLPKLTAAPAATTEKSLTAVYVAGAVYLFFLFSHAVEFVDDHGRFHLMVLLALVSGIAAALAGQLPNALKSRPGIFLSLFTGLLIVGIPFSSWKGGSVQVFLDTWWKSYATFFLVAALIFNLRQMRRSFFILASATAGILYFAHKVMRIDSDGRVSGEYGSLGNANDLAGALLMCLPFVCFVILDKRRSAAIRLVFLGMSGFLLAMVVKTGSRASLLVIAFMGLIVFFKANPGKKALIIGLGAVLACAFPFFVSKDLMDRYKTTFESGSTEGMSETQASAVESSNARKELVKNALYLTVRYPVFGVGIGNFSFQSANLEIAKGNLPLWYTCHDIYLLVSSETGVAGFLCFMGAMLSTAAILIRIGKRSRGVAELEGVSDMAFCLLMSLAAYASCGIFNTNAYTMQMPALAGLAVAFDRLTAPYLAQAEQRRIEAFRNAIPVTRSRHADAAAAALSVR